MQLPEPYKLADKVLAALNKRIVLLFSRKKRSLLFDGFDELAVYQGMTAMYEVLIRENDTYFRELCAGRYREMYLYLRGEEPDRDDIDDLVDMYLAGLLTKPNDLTHYAYDAESLRKRDRAIEAVNAADKRNDKDLQFDRAMRYWSQQTGFYIDIIADDMALKAMKDCGVEKVRWRILNDGRVCDDCHDLNGNVYDIDNVPPKPHLRCRCWLEPITTGTKNN